MKFRKHRGSIEDSMRTQIEINSMEELIDYIEEDFKIFNRKVTSIKFKYMGFDERVNQESYNVIALFNNNEAENIVGTSDEDKI